MPSHIHAKHQYGKNKSTKASGALYIPTYEYNYKVITGCDTILQENYITDRPKYKNTKSCTIMNCTKGAHLSQRGTRDSSRGPGRIGPQTVCR